MKFKFSLILTFVLLNFLTTPLVAKERTTPAPQAQTNWTNEFKVENQPLDVISLLKNFIIGFDSVLGGFIFYTPDPLQKTLILKDKSEIPGIIQYRDMFYQIAIPVLAIIIAGIAIMKLGSDNAQDLKAFAKRFTVTIALFITIPFILSYSIQFNNLLVARISSTQEFTAFVNSYLDKSEEQINQNEAPEKFGIPSFDMSLSKGVFKSVGKFVVQIFLFAITFLFLLGGLLYIGFQSVIRFAALLFLGVLFPIVIPFALSERTENILKTYLKTWFTFLFQQPAFALGFAIATDIFTNILNSQGPGVGLLFFYSGFLFFLGGVNMLVSSLIGNVWSTLSTNMTAAIATRSFTLPVSSSLRNLGQGLFGSPNLSFALGQGVRKTIGSFAAPKNEEGTNDGKSIVKATFNNSSNSSLRRAKTSSPSALQIPIYSGELVKRGMEVDVENPKQGIVSLSGQGYQYNDNKKGLSTIYPTLLEAVQDGVKEDRLRKVTLDNEQFIDLSSFGKHNPNPHNFNAMQESLKAKKDIAYAHITAQSPPDKVKHFLEMAKSRNDAMGVKGVIVKRQGTKSSDNIIRLYTKL